MKCRCSHTTYFREFETSAVENRGCSDTLQEQSPNWSTVQSPRSAVRWHGYSENSTPVALPWSSPTSTYTGHKDLCSLSTFHLPNLQTCKEGKHQDTNTSKAKNICLALSEITSLFKQQWGSVVYLWAPCHVPIKVVTK